MMYCAECGEQMYRSHHKAWIICCNGYGYWYTSKPLPSDGWWPVTTVGKYTFYPTVKWEYGRNPTPPRTPK